MATNMITTAIDDNDPIGHITALIRNLPCMTTGYGLTLSGPADNDQDRVKVWHRGYESFDDGVDGKGLAISMVDMVDDGDLFAMADLMTLPLQGSSVHVRVTLTRLADPALPLVMTLTY